MRRQPVPDGVKAGSRTWPIVLAFAVLMEQQLEANRQKDQRGNRSWLSDEPAALMRHLIEEVEEVDAAVAASVHGAMNGDRIRGVRVLRVREEGADVGNLAMMVVDRVMALNPVRDWPLAEDVTNDPLKAPPSHDANPGGRSAAEAMYVSCTGRDLAIIAQRLAQVGADLTNSWKVTPASIKVLNDLQAALVEAESQIRTEATEICPSAAEEAREAFDWAKGQWA